MDEKQCYKIEDWTDVEHCVYHALVDKPENIADSQELANHRIAHFLSRLTATLIENGSLTGDEVEEFLATCRR